MCYNLRAMKSGIHPQYHMATVTCSCGNSFVVGSTLESLHVDVCAKCHPFFTGAQKFLDTLGKVDRFIAKRQAASGYVKKSKDKTAPNTAPQSLKEMLTVTKTDKS